MGVAQPGARREFRHGAADAGTAVNSTRLLRAAISFHCPAVTPSVPAGYGTTIRSSVGSSLTITPIALSVRVRTLEARFANASDWRWAEFSAPSNGLPVKSHLAAGRFSTASA